MSTLTELEVKDLDAEMTTVYDNEDIELRLSNLPRIKYQQGEKVAEAYERVLSAKHGLEVEKAKAHLRARKDDSLTSEGDRKAWASTQDGVIACEMALIAHQGELKAAELKYEAIDDLFTAVKKLASLRQEQVRDQANATRGRS